MKTCKEQVEEKMRKAWKRGNAEEYVYYAGNMDKSACASFQEHEGSWAHSEWLKTHAEKIEETHRRMQRLG